jgi:hypothetical protein
VSPTGTAASNGSRPEIQTQHVPNTSLGFYRSVGRCHPAWTQVSTEMYVVLNCNALNCIGITDWNAAVTGRFCLEGCFNCSEFCHILTINYMNYVRRFRMALGFVLP